MKKCSNPACGYMNQPNATVCEQCFLSMGPTGLKLISIATGKFRKYDATQFNYTIGHPLYAFLADPEKDAASHAQFRLSGMVDSGPCWKISHVSVASLPTLLNDIPLSGEVVLANGQIISVGGKAKLLVEIQ